MSKLASPVLVAGYTDSPRNIPRREEQRQCHIDFRKPGQTTGPMAPYSLMKFSR